jgi:hypothetical protein
MPDRDSWMKEYEPIDISKLVSSEEKNIVKLKWIHPTNPNKMTPNVIDTSKKFVFQIFMARKLTAEDLLSRVKDKRIKPPEFTQSIIRDKLRNDDDEVATTSFRASLICPLSKMRIKIPGRSISTSCNKHIKCFDLQSFLSLMEKKPKWSCPVCYHKIDFETLVIDGLFTEILASEKSFALKEVQFHDNEGVIEWSSSVNETKESNIVDCPIDLDVDEVFSPGKRKREKKDGSQKEVVDLTLDSDEEDNPQVSRMKLSPQKKVISRNPIVLDSDDSSSDTSRTPSSRPESLFIISEDTSNSVSQGKFEFVE